MRGKKSTLLTTLTIIVTIISLVSCFGVLGVTNSVQGISIQEKKEWKVIISDVSKLAMDQGAMEVIHEPSFDKYKVNYGLKFINVGHSQFEFTIKNDGDIDAIVNDIKVNYQIKERRPGDIDACYADPSYAFEKLNWKAEAILEASTFIPEAIVCINVPVISPTFERMFFCIIASVILTAI